MLYRAAVQMGMHLHSGWVERTGNERRGKGGGGEER